MNASSVFIFSVLTLILFNVAYGFANPDYVFDVLVSGVLGFVLVVLAVVSVASLQVLGSGINDAGVKIVFGVGSLINLLFRISLTFFGFPVGEVGIGLASTLLTVFDASDFMGLGYITATAFSLIVIVSGLIIITGGD